jgi:hypothetical protein
MTAIRKVKWDPRVREDDMHASTKIFRTAVRVREDDGLKVTTRRLLLEQFVDLVVGCLQCRAGLLFANEHGLDRAFLRFSHSSRAGTTPSACIRAWAICRRLNLKSGTLLNNTDTAGWRRQP